MQNRVNRRAFEKAIFIYLMLLTGYVEAEFYEDSRCTCACLNPDMHRVKIVYQENYVAPEHCNCIESVVPRITSKLNVSLLTFCSQCECRYEVRNTKTVMIVVIILCSVISAMTLYMVSLMVLNVIARRRNVSRQNHERDANDVELEVLLNDSGEENSDYY